MAQSVRYEERCLQQLLRVLELMCCEIRSRLSPALELSTQAEQMCTGVMRAVFHDLSRFIAAQEESDTEKIISGVLKAHAHRLPLSCERFLLELGQILGAYDTDVQIGALEGLAGRVSAALSELRRGKADRCRSYEVLAVCAGCALAIILL